MTTLPDISQTLSWLSRNTRPVGDLADAKIASRVLDALTRTHEDKPAAAGTVQRKRGVIVNALSQGSCSAGPVVAGEVDVALAGVSS